MRRRRLGRRGPYPLLRDESGVFLILYAVLMVGLLGMVAIVIDLSQLRSVRRTSQSVTDFASLAAASELGDVSGADPVRACQDAFDYVRKNAPDFPAASSVPCGDLGDPARVPCVNGVTPPLELQAVADAPYDLRIVYPVSDAMIDDPRRGGTGVADGNPCERMRVLLRKTGDSSFASIFGVGSLEQGAASTARGFVQADGEDTPALLILEKESCGALQASGQGGILAKGSGIKPGLIAVSSIGSATPGGCTNNNNAGGKVVWGTALPPSHPTRPNQPSIEALEAETVDPATGTKRPPVLSVFAFDTPNTARSAAELTTGVRPDPVGGPRFTRTPVDNRYGVGIASLRTTAASPPGSYTALSSILPGCKVDASNKRITQNNVAIDCAVAYQGGPTGSDEIIFAGENFKVTRDMEVGSSKRWVFESPRLIVVGSGLHVKNQGELLVNVGPYPPATPLSPTHCTDNRNGPSVGTTRFVVRDGGFEASGPMTKLCQTTLYMAAGGPSPRPDNEDNTDAGTINFGASGSTDWTAPDQTDQPACNPPVITGCYDSTDARFRLEDLALWTESAPLSRIGGAGQVFLTGIFFLPNATFNFDGQALQDIDRNAQFVARKLDMSGKGTLVLKPDPNEAISVRRTVSGLIR